MAAWSNRLFEGKGHGWRKTIEQELIFYEKVLGLTDEEEGVGLPAWCKFDLLDCSHAMRALSAAPHLLADTRHSIICGRSAGWYIVLATACCDCKTFATATSGQTRHASGRR